jgi:hypothetical protein
MCYVGWGPMGPFGTFMAMGYGGIKRVAPCPGLAAEGFRGDNVRQSVAWMVPATKRTPPRDAAAHELRVPSGAFSGSIIRPHSRHTGGLHGAAFIQPRQPFTLGPSYLGSWVLPFLSLGGVPMVDLVPGLAPPTTGSRSRPILLMGLCLCLAPSLSLPSLTLLLG